MKMEDLYDDICLDAEAEGDKELWLKAAAVALLIALQKNAKARAEYWTEEAVYCIISADPEAIEEFEGLLRYSTWRALDEVVKAFEERYLSLGKA